MRICMLTRTLSAHSIGGMELHISTLCRSLALKGHDIVVVTTRHPDGIEEQMLDGVKIRYLAGTVPGKYSRAWWRQSVQAVRTMHAERPFDVIHSQSAGGFGLLLNGVPRQLHIPFVTSLHGTSIDEIKTRLRLGMNFRAIFGLFKNLWSYMGKDRRCFPMADAIIATSDSQVDVITKWYPVDPRRVKLVYNGIDTELFCPGSAPAPGPVILSVARLKKEKGLQNIIAAMPAILRVFPKAVLEIAGEGEYRGDLEAAVRIAGLQGSVVFIGRVDYAQLPGLIHRCSVFVNSTIRENGYDLTIPQAMACGRPVVVSDIRSVVASVVEDNRDGLVYPRADIGALADRVIGLLGDPSRTAILGAAARAKAVARFSLGTMAANTAAVYESVLVKR